LNWIKVKILIILNHSSGININNTNNKVIIDITEVIALLIVMFSGVNQVLYLDKFISSLYLLGTMRPINGVLPIEIFFL